MALLWKLLLHVIVAVGLQPSEAFGACPNGFHFNPHHNSCVKMTGSTKIWPQAREECAAMGSALVTVDSLAMVEFMHNLITQSSLFIDYFWIIYNDIWTENTFRSALNGSLMTYENFCKKNVTDYPQPNDMDHGQNCIVQNVVYFLPPKCWQDKPCNIPNGYKVACELWPGDIPAKHFRRTDVIDLTVINLRRLRQMTSSVLLECAMACSRDIICDAFAHLRQLSGAVAENCLLFTLDDDTPSPLEMFTQDLRYHTFYILEA